MSGYAIDGGALSEKEEGQLRLLGAERDDDNSCRPNSYLSAILAIAEARVDATDRLTRRRPSGYTETAQLSFDESGWSLRIRVRNTTARGRGSRGFYDATGNGHSPRAALDCFLERMPFFVQATS